MMEKHVQGIGVEDPKTCTHGDLDPHEDMAICNICNRVLSALPEGTATNDTAPEIMDDVEIRIIAIPDDED